MGNRGGEDRRSTADVFSKMMSEPDLWRKLMSTGGCWFIYDIAYCKYFALS